MVETILVIREITQLSGIIMDEICIWELVFKLGELKTKELDSRVSSNIPVNDSS